MVSSSQSLSEAAVPQRDAQSKPSSWIQALPHSRRRPHPPEQHPWGPHLFLPRRPTDVEYTAKPRATGKVSL